MSRRDFFKIIGLGGVSAILTACYPELTKVGVETLFPSMLDCLRIQSSMPGEAGSASGQLLWSGKDKSNRYSALMLTAAHCIYQASREGKYFYADQLNVSRRCKDGGEDEVVFLADKFHYFDIPDSDMVVVVLTAETNNNIFPRQSLPIVASQVPQEGDVLHILSFVGDKNTRVPNYAEGTFVDTNRKIWSLVMYI